MKLKPQKRRSARAPRLSEEPIVWPEGHYRVTSGPILPDDLCLSVMTREWKRADDPGWTSPAIDAEDAFMVARKARHRSAAGQSSRSYTIARYEEPPDEIEPTVLEDLADNQGSLF